MDAACAVLIHTRSKLHTHYKFNDSCTPVVNLLSSRIAGHIIFTHVLKYTHENLVIVENNDIMLFDNETLDHSTHDTPLMSKRLLCLDVVGHTIKIGIHQIRLHVLVFTAFFARLQRKAYSG
jgi:hypothetical protein